jgi:hypothetical protein
MGNHQIAVTSKSLGRAQLWRQVTWRCGCVLEMPALDSRDSWLTRTAISLGLIRRTRFLTRCANSPLHLGFRERARLVKEAQRLAH